MGSKEQLLSIFSDLCDLMVLQCFQVHHSRNVNSILDLNWKIYPKIQVNPQPVSRSAENGSFSDQYNCPAEAPHFSVWTHLKKEKEARCHLMLCITLTEAWVGFSLFDKRCVHVAHPALTWASCSSHYQHSSTVWRDALESHVNVLISQASTHNR